MAHLALLDQGVPHHAVMGDRGGEVVIGHLEQVGEEREQHLEVPALPDPRAGRAGATGGGSPGPPITPKDSGAPVPPFRRGGWVSPVWRSARRCPESGERHQGLTMTWGNATA